MAPEALDLNAVLTKRIYRDHKAIQSSLIGGNLHLSMSGLALTVMLTREQKRVGTCIVINWRDLVWFGTDEYPI